MNCLLRYLICYAGVTGAQRLDTLRRTGWDDVHKCQAYLCATKEEWDMLGTQIVAKANRRLYMAVELYYPDTQERRVLKGDEVLQFVAGTATAPLAEPAPRHPDSARIEAEYTLDCIKATLRHYAGQPATPDVLLECVTRITNAVRGDSSKSQEGSEPVEPHKLDEAGATPAPATLSIPKVGQSGTDAVEASAPTEGTLSNTEKSPVSVEDAHVAFEPAGRGGSTPPPAPSAKKSAPKAKKK